MSISYFVYNDASGEILRCGSCPAGDLYLQAGTGETVRQGTADDSTQAWDSSTMQLVGRPSPSSTTAELWAEIRHLRGRELSACDWTQLPDVPLTTQQAWQTYRQALRDITTQLDPLNIVWPTPPV